MRGRLVLEDRIASGTLEIADGLISRVILDVQPSDDGPYICPGYVDIHVHGWGGHSAMDGRAALDGMARALLRQGVTSFLPTAVTAPLAALEEFAASVRSWLAYAPADGAQPLGFNLEGPFLSPKRAGAQDPAHLRVPSDVALDSLEPLLDGLRVITVAPELPGALDLIGWLSGRGVVVSLGHSDASYSEATDGYLAGARSTTHLFNAMSGVDHRHPGLAVVALRDPRVWVELIADLVHVHGSLWSIVSGAKPTGTLILVSDGIGLGGMGDGRGRLGSLEVEVAGPRATLAGTTTLAGSVTGLGTMVRNLSHLVDERVAGLPYAVAAASRNPLDLLRIFDRGVIAPGKRADLVELGEDRLVRRVMLAGTWHEFDAG